MCLNASSLNQSNIQKDFVLNATTESLLLFTGTSGKARTPLEVVSYSFIWFTEPDIKYIGKYCDHLSGVKWLQKIECDSYLLALQDLYYIHTCSPSPFKNVGLFSCSPPP